MQSRLAGMLDMARSNRNAARLIAASAMIALCTDMTAAGDTAPAYRCAHGKPGYCFKYGQSFCRKNNIRDDAKTACAEWVGECITCQTAIHDCFDRVGGTIKDGSEACKTCHAEMSACMAKIDKKYWPNR